MFNQGLSVHSSQSKKASEKGVISDEVMVLVVARGRSERGRVYFRKLCHVELRKRPNICPVLEDFSPDSWLSLDVLDFQDERLTLWLNSVV